MRITRVVVVALLVAVAFVAGCWWGEGHAQEAPPTPSPAARGGGEPRPRGPSRGRSYDAWTPPGRCRHRPDSPETRKRCAVTRITWIRNFRHDNAAGAQCLTLDSAPSGRSTMRIVRVVVALLVAVAFVAGCW